MILPIRSVTRPTSSLISLSQTRITFHPSARSSCRTRLSRTTFVLIFRIQYSLLWPLASFLIRLERFLPCQKSPSTKTANLARSKTRSGHPGSAETFLRRSRSSFRTERQSFSSHVVPRFLLAAEAIRLARADAGRRPTKLAEARTRFEVAMRMM